MPLSATPDADLTLTQRRVLAVLLAGGTAQAAAKDAGVHLRTVRRWLADRAFAEVMRAMGREAAREAQTMLLAAQREAIQALLQVCRTGSPSLQVRAAEILLERGERAAADDLDQRVSELKKQQHGNRSITAVPSRSA